MWEGVTEGVNPLQWSGSEDVPPGVTAAVGALAAVASSSASFPLEVVRCAPMPEALAQRLITDM